MAGIAAHQGEDHNCSISEFATPLTLRARVLAVDVFYVRDIGTDAKVSGTLAARSLMLPVPVKHGTGWHEVSGEPSPASRSANWRGLTTHVVVALVRIPLRTLFSAAPRALPPILQLPPSLTSVCARPPYAPLVLGLALNAATAALPTAEHQIPGLLASLERLCVGAEPAAAATPEGDGWELNQHLGDATTLRAHLVSREQWEIDRSALVINEGACLGRGSFGEVHKGLWRGTEAR